ncbi:DUF6316 family protein [Tamilnaduibacter salinus]
MNGTTVVRHQTTGFPNCLNGSLVLKITALNGLACNAKDDTLNHPQRGFEPFTDHQSGERLTTTTGPLVRSSDVNQLRSRRFMKTHSGWWVKTRESQDLGPYPTGSDAREALHKHIQTHQDQTERTFSIELSHGMAVHDVSTCSKQTCALCHEALSLVAGATDDNSQR